MNLDPSLLPLPARRPPIQISKRFVLTAETWEEALRGAKTPSMNAREYGESRRRAFEKFSRDMVFGRYFGRGYVEPTAKEELLSRLNATLRGKINGSPTSWRGLPSEND